MAKNLRVRWVGGQFRNASLAVVNREICSRLAATPGVELEAVNPEPDDDALAGLPRFAALARSVVREPTAKRADVHVRHRWPPDFTPPPTGAWVVVQPWEYGGLPASWLAAMRDDVDQVWCHTTWQRDCYADSGVPAEKLRVVPHGVDAGLFSPEGDAFALRTDRTFKFLFLGGAVARKGFDVAVESYARAFTADDDVCLVVKGSSHLYRSPGVEDAIEHLRRQPGAPAVEYLDADLPDGDVAALYRACDALLVPYRGEAFGMPIAEAMAAGLPVVATSYGACLDWCDDGVAWMVPAAVAATDVEGEPPGPLPYWQAEPDRQALVETLRRVVDDDAGRATRAAAARRRALERFSWDRTAATVLAELRALAEVTPVRLSERTISLTGPRREPFVSVAPPPPAARVTVVVVTRDQAGELAACLTSVIEHTPEDRYDVVIVDRGSADATRLLLDRLEGDVTIVDLERAVPWGAAANRGLAHADGDVVCLLDASASVTAGWLDRSLAALAEEDVWAGCGGRVVTPERVTVEAGRHLGGTDDTGDSARRLRRRLSRLPVTVPVPRAEVDALGPQFAVLRRDALEEVGGFDDLLDADAATADLAVRLGVRGWRLGVVPDVVVVDTATRPTDPAVPLTPEVWERRQDVAARRTARPSAAKSPQGEPGLNIDGFFQSMSGLGEAIRLVADVAEAAGIPHGTWSADLYQSVVERGHEHRHPGDGRFATTIVGVNPQGLAQYFRARGKPRKGQRTIGYWFWETERLPERLHLFDGLDEVWAGSRFVQRAVQKVAPVPVHAFPLPVRPPRPPTHRRADLGLPERFTFLFMFDYPSLAVRKNPLLLIEAFTKAFAPGEGPALVVKATRGDGPAAPVRDKVRRAAASHPDVFLTEERLDDDANHDLVGLADAYVSLHAAEGFGLTMAEAMAHGKPVVATAYSGNLDFMSEETGFLVPYDLVPAPEAFTGPHVQWARPHLDAAVAALRAVYYDRDEAARRGERAARDIARHHSVEARAELLRQLLALPETRENHGSRPSGPPKSYAASTIAENDRESSQVAKAGADQ